MFCFHLLPLCLVVISVGYKECPVTFFSKLFYNVFVNYLVFLLWGHIHYLAALAYEADAFVDYDFRGALDEDSDSTGLRRVSYYGGSSLALGVEWKLENNIVLFALLNHLLSRDFALSEVLDKANFSDISGCFLESSVIRFYLGS